MIPWMVAFQIPLSMEFLRQEYWNGLPFSSLGYFPDPGVELRTPELAGGLFATESPGKAQEGTKET